MKIVWMIGKKIHSHLLVLRFNKALQPYQVEQSMKVSGEMSKEKAMEDKNGLTAPAMKVTG